MMNIFKRMDTIFETAGRIVAFAALLTATSGNCRRLSPGLFCGHLRD